MLLLLLLLLLLPVQLPSSSIPKQLSSAKASK
jgi:hypothetical protein